MKIKFITFSIISIAICSTLLTSCTQPDKKGDLVIWWNQALSDSAQANSLTGIKIYVDNEYIGNYITTDYWTGAPDCGSNGSIGFNKNLGQSSSANVTVQLKNAADDALKITATSTITDGQCSKLQLTW